MSAHRPRRCAAANTTTGQQCANLARRGEWCQTHGPTSPRYTGNSRLFRLCAAPNCREAVTLTARYATLTTLILRWECLDGHQWEERLLPGTPTEVEIELLDRPNWLNDPFPVDDGLGQLLFDIEPPEVAQ